MVVLSDGGICLVGLIVGAFSSWWVGVGVCFLGCVCVFQFLRDEGGVFLLSA